MPRPFASVRARAALAATLVVSVALVAAGIALVTVLRHNLVDRAGLESEVTARTVAGSQAALHGNFGSLNLPEDDGHPVQVVGSPGKVLAAGDDLHGHGPLTDYAPAPAPRGTAAPSRSSDGSDDDHHHDDHTQDDKDNSNDNKNDGNDGDGSPARGKVGTDVDHKTLALKLGDDFHDYAFAAVRATTYDDRTYTVYAGTSLEDSQATLGQVIQAMLIGLPFLLAVVAAVTWLVTHRALRPVEGIRAEMAEITGSGDLARRVPEPASRDEIARLARTTNATLAALEQSVERQHRFVADASHELRSPIASLRTQLEVAEQHPELLDTADLHQDVVRLQHLAADLLLLARLDAGERATGTLIDLAALVREDVARRATIDRITPAVTLDDTTLEVKGSRTQLSRVLCNLLDNAQRHAATSVAVTVRAVGGTVVLSVADDGHGVVPADRERVFERFVRLDEARTRDEGGAGLGLAIARDVVQHHGGTLTLTDAPDGGADFQVRLPLAH
ncbi:sensor histidine kinase [Streptomyces sp. NPDC056160]|uniref:sensor histidine kinase n=1 Tax=Streptomyces sp. NPDC056160 TaxID=3345731 RepID=UPI0035DE620A